jgi:ribosomal protein L37E
MVDAFAEAGPKENTVTRRSGFVDPRICGIKRIAAGMGGDHHVPGHLGVLDTPMTGTTRCTRGGARSMHQASGRCSAAIGLGRHATGRR